jgi:hypothetical protein
MTAAFPALSALPGSLLAQPQVIFFLLVGALWLIKAISRAKAAFLSEDRGPQEADSPAPAERAGPVEMGLSDEERALLVRREILQKRAQRQAGAAAPARAPDVRRAPAPPALARGPATAGGAPAAFPGALAPSSPPSRGPSAAAPSGAPAAEPVPSPGSVWLEELRNRDSVRRAVILREILGQPVGLR